MERERNGRKGGRNILCFIAEIPDCSNRLGAHLPKRKLVADRQRVSFVLG